MFFYHPDIRSDFSAALSGLGFERCMLATPFAGGSTVMPSLRDLKCECVLLSKKVLMTNLGFN